MLQGGLVWFGLVVVCALSIASAQVPRLEVRGHVRDDNGAPVSGARVTLRRAGSNESPWQAQTDAAGSFAIAVPGPGDYRVDVEREGYYQLENGAVRLEAGQELTLVIVPVREVFQSVDVTAQPSPVDITQTDIEKRLTGTEINNIGYPNSHSLRSSLKLVPGVVEDSTGGVHFNGASENQVQYLLNGFNITDPVSAEFHTTLAVEGIRSVDYASGRYSPEFGKGSAGVLAINTAGGTDAFRYTATNFVPGVQLQQGVRIGNWYPRLGVSGPIVRGRAWFADNFSSEYTTAFLTGLPSGQNTRHGWTGSNLLHAQVNLTPRQILFADFLANVNNAGRVGLGPLDPLSTTRNLHGHQYLGSLRDQLFLGAQTLIEFGYAHNEFVDSQRPQGQDLYVYSAQGRSGNYFVRSTQTSSRDQGLVHVYAPQFSLAGTHQIVAGLDADLKRYHGDFHRTGYEVAGLSGQILSRTTFTGPGVFTVHDTELSSWALDTWRISERLQIDAGIRQDWDRLVRNHGWSPRVSFSWAPFAGGRTRVAGGYSVTRDVVPMDPFGRVLDQRAVTTAYDNGVPAGPPLPTTFTRGPASLRLPRATNWSLSVDHQVSAHLFISASYLRRRGTAGFSFLNTLAPDAPPSLLPLPNATSPGAYQLANLRRDDYDAAQFSVHHTLSGQYEWMISYTWSRALSNAVLDANGTTPLQVLPMLVAMPWNTPHRLLAWAYLPLPWKNWSLSAVADARSGYPFSVQGQTGVISGAVNSHHYPFNFDLNLTIERIFVLHGYRFALRGGVNNLTNQRNPRAVNNVIGSPQYLQFFGNEGRHFVVRIRFFGRAGTT